MKVANNSSRTFPFHRFSGTHRQIGQQFGEACRDLIRDHLETALSRLRLSSTRERTQALSLALEYRPFVVGHAPFLDEEIRGIAEGASLSLAETYFLQLRAEIMEQLTSTLAPEVPHECTTFALSPAAGTVLEPIGAQNADLPEFYARVSIVAEIVPNDAPSVLIFTPAGQVSYIGINDRGLGVFANYLHCGGWRLGFPRYLLSRIALLNESVDAACDAIEPIRRASSRNLLLFDSRGEVADLELTPDKFERLYQRGGILAHSNHFVGNSLLAEERLTGSHLNNSHVRLGRATDLLNGSGGPYDVEAITKILRDRRDAPDALCRMKYDDDTDIITVASVIAEPASGRLTIAVGPPNEHPYRRYEFSS